MQNVSPLMEKESAGQTPSQGSISPLATPAVMPSLAVDM
jgi:hypothetical protein